MNAPLAMTVTEAAKALRMRRSRLEEAIRSGELPAFSVGPQRGTRISLRALERFIEQRTFNNTKSL
jgi:excisionase family DNA binding protein